MTNLFVIKNLRHRPMRTCLTVAAIALEVAMVLLILGLADGLVEESSIRKRSIGADILIRSGSSSVTVSSGTGGLPASLVEKIEQMPEVAMALGSGAVLQKDLQSVRGVDLEKLDRMSGGIEFLEGRRFQSRDEIVIDETYARQKDVGVGDTLRVLNRDFRVSGIIEPGKMSRMFTSIDVLRRSQGWGDEFSEIHVQLRDPAQTTAVIAALKQMLPDARIYSMEEFLTHFTAETRGTASEFVGAFIGIALAVGFIVVLMSMYTAVLDRTREIGILKALGASSAFIAQVLLREALLLTAMGLFLGVAISYLSSEIIENRFPLVTVMIMDKHLWWALTVALAASLLGTLYPVGRAVRQDTIAALTYE